MKAVKGGMKDRMARKMKDGRVGMDLGPKMKNTGKSMPKYSGKCPDCGKKNCVC